MNMNQIKAKLKFYLSKNYNVLLIGEHGTGKTSIVKQIFEEENINYAYFSASTMDPWVDFIGIPKERMSVEGTPYLDLVRPQSFAEDKIEAIILDEFNRSHKKVRNAVMELIQFKTINGRHFKNLRVVWAAINPHDEEETYAVEKLDPAQYDRFQVKIHFENKPDRAYFAKKYGPEWAGIAIDWFNKATNHFEEMKKKNAAAALDIYRISPRTLDYALQIAHDGGEIQDALPSIYNVSELWRELSQGSTSSILKKLFDAKDTAAAKTFVNKSNIIENAVALIKKNKEYKDFFIPLINSEDLVRFATQSDDSILEFMTDANRIADYVETLESIEKSKQLSPTKLNKIIKALNEHRVNLRKQGLVTDKVTYLETKKTMTADEMKSFMAEITSKETIDKLNILTQDRERVYNQILNNYPSNFINKESEIAMLKILFKIIESSQHGSMVGKYDSMIPLINSITRKLMDNGVDVNAIQAAIKTKVPVEHMRLSKIQTYLDSNLNILHAKITVV